MRSFVEKRRTAFFIEKSDIFLKKSLDISSASRYNNTRRQGHGPRQKEYADVAELADALDSGSSSLKRVWVQIPSSAPKSSNVCSGIFCFVDLLGMTGIVPLRRCRRAALHIHKMSAVQIHLSYPRKHFLRNFSRVIPSKSVCFCGRYSCTPLAICTGCAIMWIVTPAACAGGCKRRTPCKACPTIMLL